MKMRKGGSSKSKLNLKSVESAEVKSESSPCSLDPYKVRHEKGDAVTISGTQTLLGDVSCLEIASKVPHGRPGHQAEKLDEV